MNKSFKCIGKILSSLILGLTLTCVFVPNVGADTEAPDDAYDVGVRETIIRGFYSFSDSIDISSYKIRPDELPFLFSSVIKDDPYLFFVEGQLSYSYKPDGCVLSLKPRYSMTGKDVFEAWDICRAYIRDLAKEAVQWDEESARALFLHNRICESFAYDEKLENDNMYLFIKNGTGTCQAYTDLYNALLRECGIESHFAASDTITHIWNCLKIDGEWYHADLTWDDGAETVLHRHFLLSDRMAYERGHKDWYTPVDVNCVSEKYADVDPDMLLHGKYSPGDVDHNGAILLLDVLLIQNAGEKRNVCIKCADVSDDGTVDETDVLLIRRTVLESVGSEAKKQ